MAKFASKKVSARTFSRAFEQMCNFVAISKVGNPAETIRGLVQYCFLDPQGWRFDAPASIAEFIDTTFGIRIEDTQIQVVIDEMTSTGTLLKPAGTNFVLATGARAELLGQIAEASTLEERVKGKWLEWVEKEYPDLPIDRMWGALRTYHSSAFKRHGIQAVTLLDPTIDIPDEYSKSLSVLLTDALTGVFEEKDRENVRKALSDFMADVASYPDRARYITQLADGAFNFYTLEVDPEVAKLLRAKLNSMLLFLDTNFLFGILGLHNNLQMEVSHELLRAVKTHKLPFELRYHEETAREMEMTVLHYGGILRSRHWSSSLSKVAAQTRYISGIELKYHEQNAKSCIDPKDFISPYENFDVLLKDRGIRVFNTRNDRQQECIDLYQDLNKYLVEKHREKPYNAVLHDATVLDTVRQQRSKATSSLEAGALLITCDYWLYQFDRDSARQQNNLACVLLPNIFWQILRPFVPSGTNFEKSFAATFALPEFRVVGSGASKACSKMLALLATYKDLPEETALKMLSNRVLLDRLLAAKDDEEFKAFVEEAFVQQNADLIEEKAALARQLEQEKGETREKEEKARKLLEQAETLREEKETLKAQLDIAKAETSALRRSVDEKQGEIEKARVAAVQAEYEKNTMNEKTQKLTTEQFILERRALLDAGIAAFSLSGFLAFLFEWFVHYLPWPWLVNHPNSLALRVSFMALIASITTGFFIRKWRTYIWGTGVIPIAIGIFKLLGH